MCRTLTLFVALAAFLVATAHGAPASASKSHRRASATRSHRPPARSTSSTTRVTTRTRATSARTGRPSAQEVGRAAGLRIRRQMNSRRAAYGRRVVRPVRYRRARLVETASITRYNAARSAPAAADAFAASARRSQSAQSELAYTEPSPAAAGAPRQAIGSIETGAAEQAAAPQEKDSAQEYAAPVAESRADDQVASLTIPRGAMPAPLKGSLASLQRQNELLAAEGLERIENEDDLAARIANRLLVPLPASDALTVNPNLTLNHRYCRPWTARFLADLARDHDALFHRPLEVSSAVRTVEYQRHLMRVNGNAAPAEGDIVSPHLTGATIDIAKEGLTRDEMKWMRHRLLEIENQGKIDVEEEFQQSCFHITVYKTYAPGRTRKRSTPLEAPQPAAPVEADGPATEGL